MLTEAGFGSDMGGEKFFNIKCYYSGLRPSCAVVVCTVRALKLHSCRAPKVVPGAALSKEYREENLRSSRRAMANLRAHINNVTKHGVAAVVAINRFHTDTDAEVALVAEARARSRRLRRRPRRPLCPGRRRRHRARPRGDARARRRRPRATSKFLYDAKADGIKSKIEAIVRGAYGGGGVEYRDAALRRGSRKYEADAALRGLPICMSKTQYSLSDDPTKLGAPKDFVVTVRDLYVSAGAGFLVVSLGDITFIPGLPIKPAYYKIDVEFPDGEAPRVVGLS